MKIYKKIILVLQLIIIICAGSILIQAIKVGSRSARISPSSRSSSVTKHAEPDTVYYMGTSSGVSDFHVKARRKP